VSGQTDEELPTMSVAPSGEQFEIRYGEQRATITEVGGGVREYVVGDRAVLEPYPVDVMCDGAHGAPLIPWPNRLADGRYRFDGVDHQVGLTEPEKQNAIHGFLRWRSWNAVEQEDRRVVVHTRIHPLTGFPFTIDVRVAYELGEEGLVVSTTATNLSDSPAPYGCGQHPYLSPGDGLINECTVQLDARTRILTDNERQLPTGSEAVEGTEFDFRSGRRLGDQAIDFAFTDLTRDPQGRAWARLSAPDGHEVALWVDEHHPYLELYTGDTLAAPRQRRGLGTEPMTCPPNAMQSGRDLIRLEAGESVTTTWGVGLVEA
jgi:aldose 1-epimerase